MCIINILTRAVPLLISSKNSKKKKYGSPGAGNNKMFNVSRFNIERRFYIACRTRYHRFEPRSFEFSANTMDVVCIY